MSLQAYRLTVDRLLSDPLSESRAAFLAARHNLGLPQVLSRLEAVRLAEPGNVAVLMAEARVAEELGRVFKAFHAVEAAALYAPEDAWVQLELHRLRLVVKLRSRDLIRDPA